MTSCDKLPHSEEDDDTNSSRPRQDGNKRKTKETNDDLKPNKKTRSKVWNHFTRDVDNRNVCFCNHCKSEMTCPTVSGTSNMRKYLGSCKKFKLVEYTCTDENQTVFSPHADKVRLVKVAEKEFREACNELLVLGELSLSFIDSLAWRNLYNKIQLYTPYSRRTTTRDIVELFVRKKAAIKKIVEDNKQRMSLTDIWVAQHSGASYMVITTHYIDASWKLKKLINGFKNICDHKAETICNVLIECLAEWSIQKIFCITVDNATANTSTMRKFRERYVVLGNDSLMLNGEHLHVRCSAYILNLVVKEGLQEAEKVLHQLEMGYNLLDLLQTGSSLLNCGLTLVKYLEAVYHWIFQPDEIRHT